MYAEIVTGINTINAPSLFSQSDTPLPHPLSQSQTKWRGQYGLLLIKLRFPVKTFALQSTCGMQGKCVTRPNKSLYQKYINRSASGS